jgi:hypothetical protein
MCLAIVLLISGPSWGGIIIRDNFDGGGVEAGDGASINGGFTLTANSIAAGSPIAETDSYAEVVTSGGANGNAGITSNTSFDALSADAMSRGLTVEWVVVSLSETTIANGLTFTIQPDNPFFNTAPYMGVMFSGKAGTSPDGVRFVAKNVAAGDPTHNLSALYNYDRATFLDGFTVRFTIRDTGWAFEVEGLDIAVAEEGLWPADLVLADILDADSYVSVHAQKSTNPITARYDSCEVWTGKKDASTANTPQPENQGGDVLRDVVLAWNAGEFAVVHDVYVGMTFDDVNDGTAGTLVSQGQTETTYDAGVLTFGQTYYWRVDEVNGAPDRTVFKGDVWSFTVEPYAIMIPVDVNHVTASSSAAANPPGLTVNGSGLDGNTHSTDSDTMWLSETPDMAAWLMFEFESLQKLDHMLIWNSNSASEGFVGWGIKDVNIETSMDGVEWTALAQPSQISKAPGQPTYDAPQSIDLGLPLAKYVRLNILSNWGGLLKQYGVAEVQFYGLPVYARTPDPASGSTGILPDSELAWRAGREAVQHTVYMATDVNAVMDGSAESVLTGANLVGLDAFDAKLDETYFWRVDEVNEAEAVSVWAGDIWNLSTVPYLTIDDFDGYGNKSPDRPFQTWLDGFGYSADEFFPAEYPGNGTGSGVGHDIWSPSSPHFGGQIMEGTIVKSGQSMPLYFNNTGGVSVSETKRTLTPAQDWTAQGIQSLSLNIYGDPGNTGQLYLKINGTRIDYHGLSDALQRPSWIPWNIDLSGVAGNLRSVTSLTIGIDGAGASGVIYIDDIRLYPRSPETVAPVVPNDGDPNLVAYYAFEGNANDSKGNYPGTANGSPVYTTGKVGQALVLDKVDDIIVNTFAQDVTWPAYSVSLWAKTDVFNQVIYSSLFNNNSAGADFQIEVDGSDRYGYRGSGAGLLGPVSSNWVHLAVTCDGTQTELYYNGLYVGTVNEARTQFGQIAIGANRGMNTLFGGTIDEVRVYDRALSLAEVAGLAGVTDEVPISF